MFYKFLRMISADVKADLKQLVALIIKTKLAT